jgi:two-component system cell cycle response regulator DivK
MAEPLALIIEDDEDISRLFVLALREARFTTEVIHNGQSALNRLADLVPDVIVLDMNLPAVSGVEILTHIRADTRLATTPVIVASANPQMSDEVYDQADLVLLKPISYEQLRDLGRRFRR